MRLILLATIICLGVCLGYAKYLEPTPPARTSYDGPATFDRLYRDPEGDADSRWLLICAIPDGRVAFDGSDAWVRKATAGLKPGQPIHLLYDLPAVVTECGSELGPPTLRGIVPLTTRMGSDSGPLAAAGKPH